MRKSLESRGEEDSLAELLELDAKWRTAVTEGDNLRSYRNQVNREVGQARRSGEEVSEETIREMRRVGERVAELEQEARSLEEQTNRILLSLPNLPLDDVPPGLDEEGNLVVRSWGEIKPFDFEPLPHWDLGGDGLRLIDFQRGVKISGSRFLHYDGGRSEAGTGPYRLDAGPPYPRTRLYRVDSAVCGQRRDHGRVGQSSQVPRQPLPRRRGRPVAHTHGGSPHYRPAPG